MTTRKSETNLGRKSEPISLGELIKDSLPEIQNMLTSVAKSLREAKHEYYTKLGFNPTPVNCKKHPGQICEFNEQSSLAKYYSESKIEILYHPCKKCREETLVDERNYKWRKMGVPKKVQAATFDNYVIQNSDQHYVLAQIRNQAERKRGFILMLGNNGTGKSHLASAVLKSMKTGIFVIEDDLITDLRRTYDEGGKERMLKHYKECPCLVIDEIDAQLKGDDINPLLYNILAYRYDKDLITVLTTNEDLATLQAILGNRIRDRVASDYVVANFTWESYRRKGATKSHPAKSH